MSVNRRPTKNEKRRSKKKENGATDAPVLNQKAREIDAITKTSNGNSSSTKVEYVSTDYNEDDNPLLEEFKSVFEKFTKPEELMSEVVVSSTDNKENTST